MILQETLNLEFDGEYAAIPAHMQESLRAYVLEGRAPGQFLQAVLKNDLFNAVGRADADNLPLLPVYVRWLYNRAPMSCYGRAIDMNAWIEHQGMAGDKA